jgi:hypothetical protein
MSKKWSLKKFLKRYGGLFIRYIDEQEDYWSWDYFFRGRYESFNDYWEDNFYALMQWDEENQRHDYDLGTVVMGRLRVVLRKEKGLSREELHYKNWFTYKAMGELVAKYEGNSPKEYLKKANSELLELYKFKLKDKNDPDEWGVEIVCKDEECSTGRSYRDRRFALEEIIEMKPIPNENCNGKDCSSFGCSCYYELKHYRLRGGYDDPFFN